MLGQTGEAGREVADETGAGQGSSAGGSHPSVSHCGDSCQWWMEGCSPAPFTWHTDAQQVPSKGMQV